MRTSVGLVLACCLAGVHAQDKIVGGPYAIHVGPRSATIMWIVESSSATIGAEPGKIGQSAPVLRAEKVSFTGLKPATAYYYDAAGKEEGKGSFKTPPSGAAAFQFVVYGDTRTRHEMHQRVVDAILKYSSPDFVLHTGDLVANGADSSQWPTFFGIERELLRKAAFFPALGNHERNDHEYYEFFDIATPYYSFDWGTSHFIVLNSDIGNAATSASARETYWTEQVRWLEEDLKKSQKADFRFLTAHHPPITAVARRQGDNPQMTALMPMFEKYHLTAGFFGHDHNYQHYWKNGVHYFVTGGGGAPLYDANKPPQGITKKVASTEHFVLVKVGETTASVEAIQLNGEPLERTELRK